MGDKYNALAIQNEDEVKNSKKIKSYKPIILLRRNSCGGIASKNTSANAIVSVPISKSVNDVKMSSTSKMKSEKMNHLSLQTGVSNDGNRSKTTVIKAETGLKGEKVGTSLPVQWTKKIKEEIPVKQNITLSLMQTNATSCFQNLPNNNFNASVPSQIISPKPFLQQSFVQQPLHINTPVFTGNRQYAPVNQLAVPVNNSTAHSILPFATEQFQSQPHLPFDHCVYSSVVPNQAASMQLTMQENRQVFYQPNSAHGIVSESAIVQNFSSPMFQVQNNNLQSSDNCTMFMNTHSSVAQQQFDSVSDDSLTNITWLGRMGVNNFMPVPLENARKPEQQQLEKSRRPPYSYMALIQFAINSSGTGKMTLRQIYQWIEDKFPYFKSAKPGWKNSIRHNLSLHDLFVREVTAGSKASFWTLRPDLNIRPLTLDSVGTSLHGPVWSLQSYGQGQKSILPRLPYCSRPYVLLPVPLMQNSKESPSTSCKVEVTDPVNQDCLSSSSLIDSGCNSDLSHCTPSTTSKTFSDSGSMLHDSGILKSEKKSVRPFPMLSQASGKSSGKRARKERLKTLNDSLNSSLQFVKEDTDSSSDPLHSSEEKLLLKKFPKKENEPTKSVYFGLSDESFTELLNDLGSPFNTYLTQESLGNQTTSPKAESARKRRRSWGSPEASGSGMEFAHKLKAANERTPVRPHIRRVKSDLVDLTQAVKNEDGLPTSTPLIKEKWKKIIHQRKKTPDVDDGDKENVYPKSHFQGVDDTWRISGGSSKQRYVLPPSPIPNRQDDSDIENNFFEDIIGSVFKTPDKPSAPVLHFDSLTPDRVPLSFVTGSFTNAATGGTREVGECSNADDPVPIFSVLSPSKEEPLNTSFSKLLDISGCSSFGRFNEADLNLGWSNFPNM